MRCAQHFNDRSSTVGVCASCLRERLFSLIAAQEERRKSEYHESPIVFPRSVSPYVGRWRSDHRFFSTPPAGTSACGALAGELCERQGKYTFLSNLFRSKAKEIVTDSNPRILISCRRESRDAATSSSFWLLNILSGRRKKQSRLHTLDESTMTDQVKNRDRRILPAICSEEFKEDECLDGSGDYLPESAQSSKSTPARERGGRLRQVSGVSFFLSPLVRASPCRKWNQKRATPETAGPGDTRCSGPHHFAGAGVCKNRSRKIANYGKSNLNR